MTTEEGFREIQLNGKQLVFLFMAATVVSVVIFLCGVLVGRGVRPDRPSAADTSAAVAPDPVEAPPPPASAPAASSTPAPSAEPPAPAEELTYFDRLQKDDPVEENLKTSSPEPSQAVAVPPPAPRSTPSAAPQPPAADAHPAVASSGEPAGPGFAVQVATYPDRRNADMLAKRLVGKGYPAFVTGPVKGGAKMIYRVRVGKYQDKRQAEAISSRLEKEEQFKPWIAR